jgi:hypothetical protein
VTVIRSIFGYYLGLPNFVAGAAAPTEPLTLRNPKMFYDGGSSSQSMIAHSICFKDSHKNYGRNSRIILGFLLELTIVL